MPTFDAGRLSRLWARFFAPPKAPYERSVLQYPAGNAPNLLNLIFDTVAAKALVSGAATAPLVLATLARKALESNAATSPVSFDAVAIKRLVSIYQVTTLTFDVVVRKALCLAIPAEAQAAPFIYSEDFGAIPIFPALPASFPVKLSPGLDTIIGTTKALREMRYPQRSVPLWDIELPFEELRDQTQNSAPYLPFAGLAQYETLVQTWLMMYGQSNVFAFDAPWDNSRSNQIIGIGDGQTWGFAVYSTWGAGAQAQTLPVGCINAITAVYVNGVLVPTSQYTYSRNKIYFIDGRGMPYPPPANAVISMTFSYYYLCRFVEDEQDFEEFAKNRWVVPSLKFRAVFWL